MNDAQRQALWRDVGESNSRLQHLIGGVCRLVARSREVLGRQQPEVGAPVGANETGERASRPKS
jgi:hypothetical protein